MNKLSNYYMSIVKQLLLILSTFLLLTGCDNDYLTINAFEAEGTTINYNLPDTSSLLKVAVVSIECSKQKVNNIEKIYAQIESIMNSNPEVELICFGEALTGWYAETPSYIYGIAEQIPGPFTDSLAYFANKHAVYISIGMAEKNGENLYNSLVVINPNGDIVGIHRKNTLTSDDQNAGYAPMQNANVITINEFKAGLMICADVNGEWLTNHYIDADIDILLSAFASPIGLPAFNLISRRMDAWQIFPNRYGNENGNYYSGLIYISDPAGNIVKHHIGSESYFTYTIAK
jgi:predicted amidohydrolase